ncbi:MULTISPECIES: helix-turn-helix domain-containing protein [unclassified Caballeronia]|uniref:helix-turn-helix domain-containing protein n=1 Tax=unclassified Caballeronia TaxID=2646786 RepID=UPI0025407345|nr:MULTISPECIES: helix-turn-helix transcriptional regulator [unclassified Caballeronia]MDR5770118.1 helix-turn-helix transcriptional regulator [Caballeronia sp. LZ028]
MDLFELGQAFRTARMAANLTQENVSERSGITRARVSRFETGRLPEIGAIKLLSLFEAVGLELYARPIGYGRTLDDVLIELRTPEVPVEQTRRRVRLPRSAAAAKTSKKVGGS